MEFEHEIALKENRLTYADLSVTLKRKINAFNLQKNKVYADPNNVDAKKLTSLKVSSGLIADDIQDFYEKDFEDDEKDNPDTNNNNQKNQNQQPMKKAAHQDLLSETKIAVKDLSESTQKDITKFATLKDGDEREELDAKIYAAIEAHAEKAKAPKKDAKIDVSKAATAGGNDDDDNAGKDGKKGGKGDKKAGDKAPEAPKKNSVFKTIFGN